MTDRFETILDESISALQAGVPIDEILEEVPDYADQLRPLLYAASLLTDPKPELVPQERKSTLRTAYMEQIADLPALPAPTFGEKIQAVSHIVRKRFSREAALNDLITVIITMTLSLTMVVLILNYLALDTIPGDFLYGFKRISENVQLALTISEEGRIELSERFNQRRLDEIAALIEQNRAAVVQFRGILETKGENLWVVEGYTVFLPNDINLTSDFKEGDLIEVIGLLRTNNVLVADTIRLIN